MLGYVNIENKNNSTFDNKLKSWTKTLNRGTTKLSIKEYTKSKNLLYLLIHIQTNVAFVELHRRYGFVMCV